ncbi:hypothetical protein LCGC14_0372590 [marine sediment metagenome]|uniref:Uncharacterized protein n=1 Tax=marine sediment metagenome TaxID=412755 RepID=A0A0F9WDC5_9ZZZZ
MSDDWDYCCFKCNIGFSIQSDKDIDEPINFCVFCGGEDIQ